VRLLRVVLWNVDDTRRVSDQLLTLPPWDPAPKVIEWEGRRFTKSGQCAIRTNGEVIFNYTERRS
jgi:hypothetical protein